MRKITIMLGAALATWVASGANEELEARFRDASATGFGPVFTLRIEQCSTGAVEFLTLLDRFRAWGAGGVLVSMPVADEEGWRALGRVSEACAESGMELGVCDFVISRQEDASLPRARCLAWSMRDGGASAVATNGLPDVVCRERSREVATLAIPVSPVLEHYQVLDLGVSIPLTEGHWRELRFGSVEASPPVIDPFDERAVIQHVNEALEALQSRLSASYGRSLVWYQCVGVRRSELLWPSDMGALFLKRNGLDLARHLPALAGFPLGGEATAAHVRRQVAEAVCDAWRGRYAQNIRDLVQEAGLDAGMRVDEAPVAPEEVPYYFRRPVITAARSERERLANVRAAGAARACARRTIMGRVPLRPIWTAVETPLYGFPFKRELDGLFADGATRVLLEADNALWNDERLSDAFRAVGAYARRCQLLLMRGEPVADLLVWDEAGLSRYEGYSCDRASRAMLEEASVRGTAIELPSERKYAALAVSTRMLREPAAERLVRQLAEKGLTLWVADNGDVEDREFIARATQSDAPFARLFRGAAGGVPQPDMTWTSDVEGLRLRFTHRRSETEEIYFIMNDSAAAGPVTAVFRDTGRGVPERWDPQDGVVSMPEERVRRPDGRLAVSLFMAPFDACFILFAR